MKPVEETVCLVADYGTFISLAEKLSESYKTVYYYSPFEQEYLNVHRCVIGDGIPNVIRLDEWLDPDVLSTIDLGVFPDQGFIGAQKLLKSMGKAVWGSGEATDLELYRTRFLDLLKDLALPMVKSVRCRGLTELAKHLKGAENKWVKVNRYRDNMETWHHIDWAHSQRILEGLAVVFGGVKEQVMFVVQDDIPDALEIGYDGWSVRGQYPVRSYQGYEKKNKLYLGSLLDREELPEEITYVNEAMAPVLEQMDYRNFIATELRVVDGKAHFIDPTNRLPGQTGEHLLESCTNLAEVILRGANGELIEPEFAEEIAVEATMIYTADTIADEWMVIGVPDEAKPWTKLYHYCEVDGMYHFPPKKNKEVGVLCGSGPTIEQAIDHLKENFKAFKNEPVAIEIEAFAELIEQVEQAEQEGMKFTDEELPDPAIVLSNGE